MSDRHSRSRQSNSPLGRFLRYLGLLVGIIVGWQIGRVIGPPNPLADYYGFPILFAAALGGLFFVATPYVTLGFFHWLRGEFRRLPAIDMVATAVGLLIGGLLSVLLAWPISLLPRPYGQVLPFFSAVIICFIAVVAVVTKKREVLGVVSRRAPGLPKSADGTAPEPRAAILLDTSAIIDGRVADLARIGFLRDELLVPHFVLRELQLVADSSDPSRRLRGRRGLDILERMKRQDHTRLEITDLDVPEEADVDSKLVKLAKNYGFLLLTGDHNLERIGVLHGVCVLNIHELAQVVRPAIVAGEELPLKIIQPGREYDQGVGYLDDGTMVVVESGKGLIGKDVTVVVTRTLQTGAGRMAFAQVKRDESA